MIHEFDVVKARQAAGVMCCHVIIERMNDWRRCVVTSAMKDEQMNRRICCTDVSASQLFIIFVEPIGTIPQLQPLIFKKLLVLVSRQDKFAAWKSKFVRLIAAVPLGG